MKDPILKINLLIRAETALARIRTRKSVSRLILSLVALVFVLIGVAMLNFAIYHSFAASFSPALSGFFVSLINLCLAAIIFIVAAKTGTESGEEKMAQEIRELAYAELGADVNTVRDELSKIGSDVNRIRTGFSSLTDTTGSILPLFGLLTKAITKNK